MLKSREEQEEYSQMCYNIYRTGGILWLIERKDKNEYLMHHLEMYRSDRPSNVRYTWSSNIGFMTVWFLTKEDAEEELKWMGLTEGGCSCCGHGSKKIDVEITEHEFVRTSESI